MYCLKEDCGGELKCTGTDSRVEWYEEFYECKVCGASHTHRVTFKPQSCLVVNDELTLDK